MGAEVEICFQPSSFPKKKAQLGAGPTDIPGAEALVANDGNVFGSPTTQTDDNESHLAIIGAIFGRDR